MISNNYIIEWEMVAPWRSKTMVEQDLIISRILVELYNDPLIKSNLIFRGGTVLNKNY